MRTRLAPSLAFAFLAAAFASPDAEARRGNRPPYAYAGDSFAITLPQTSARLDGTRSSDSDGRIVAASWTQEFGPNRAVFESADRLRPRVSGLVAGKYKFWMKVVDDRGASASDWVVLTVRPGTAPIPSPAPSPRPSPSPSPSPRPALSPRPSPTPSPSPSPTATVAPSPTPTASPIPPASLNGTVAPSIIPYSDPDLVAPGRGAEIWHNVYMSVDVPIEGQGVKALDKYYRFLWRDFEDKTPGVYNWRAFDTEINIAIDNGQKFSFGVMSLNPGVSGLSYPTYVHERMQAEAVKDYQKGVWIPNWNSPSYLDAYANLQKAIAAHIEAGSYKGVRYKDIITAVDIRGYGHYGEWWLAELADEPAGTHPTVATYKRLIDMHVEAFPDFPLSLMIAAFDGMHLGNTRTPLEVGYYALTARNDWGPLGWRRDNWGAMDDYLRRWLDLSEKVYTKPDGTKFAFREPIMSRWKTSPITGEPINGGSEYAGNCQFHDLENQVRRYRATSFGNGNIFGVSTIPCARENFRAGSKASGYRLQVTGGAFTAKVGADRKLSVSLNWKNVGVAPTYEDWDATFELRKGSGELAWSGKSAMVLKRYLPDHEETVNGKKVAYPSDKTVVDSFALPAGLAPGEYSLSLVVKDPKGYRKPLPLAIRGRTADGAYPLGGVTVP